MIAAAFFEPDLKDPIAPPDQEQRDARRGQEDSRQRSRGGEDATLDEHLPDQTAFAGRQGRAHGEVFRDIRPAATLVQVASLVRSDLLVEIEATAVVPDA